MLKQLYTGLSLKMDTTNIKIGKDLKKINYYKLESIDIDSMKRPFMLLHYDLC